MAQSRETLLAKKRDYYHARKAANPEKVLEEFRVRSAKRRKDPNYNKWFRDYMRKRNFGLSREDYDSMLAVVPGCAICGGQPKNKTSGKIQNFTVDHDHKTGRIRGLLCSECNFGLGKFKDDPKLLMAAIEYLREPGDNQMIIQIERTSEVV